MSNECHNIEILVPDTKLAVIMQPPYRYTRPEQGKCKKYGLAALRSLYRCGRDFCLETSMHGFNHIAVPGRHWIERLLWLLTTTGAIWGAIGVSLGQLQRFNENPTVITIEKDFRTWLFSLPALTTCDLDRVNPSKLSKAISSRWQADNTDAKYPYYERFVHAVANSDLYNLEAYEEFKDDPSLDVDLYELAVEVMPEFQVKATWSHGAAAKWLPVITEAGVCFVTNSVAIADLAIVKLTENDTSQFPMTCKYSALSCYVILEVAEKADFYVHSPYDVADITSYRASVFASLNRQTELSVMETGCGQGVRGLQPQRRGCRFTDEPDHATQVYSTNACRVSCRSHLAIKLCRCKPFYYIYEEGPVCTPAGMWCLSAHAEQLEALGGVKCSCSPQCLDATFRELTSMEEMWAKGPFSTRGALRFTVQPPRTRYTREIVFYFQDLVVSFGGAAGLFLGASFISFVEIFYFLIERTMGLCVKPSLKNPTGVKKVQPIVPYETTRIMELNSILDKENKFQQLLEYQWR